MHIELGKIADAIRAEAEHIFSHQPGPADLVPISQRLHKIADDAIALAKEAEVKAESDAFHDAITLHPSEIFPDIVADAKEVGQQILDVAKADLLGSTPAPVPAAPAAEVSAQ